MCDYCSCRAMPLIEALGTEHELLTELAGDVRRAIADGDAHRARERFGQLVSLLRVHDAVEEAGVFAALRAAGELGDDVDSLLADHTAAWAVIDHLDGACWDDQVLALMADLAQHIAREEYDLFPATLLTIPPDGWDAAEQAAAEVRRRAA